MDHVTVWDGTAKFGRYLFVHEPDTSSTASRSPSPEFLRAKVLGAFAQDRALTAIGVAEHIGSEVKAVNDAIAFFMKTGRLHVTSRVIASRRDRTGRRRVVNLYAAVRPTYAGDA